MMKNFTKVVGFLLIALTGFFTQIAEGQSILNPNDSVVTYNPNGPAPVQPFPNQIGKWVRTKRLSWNTDSYKAYIYNGVAFRLKFPKSYDPAANDGKVYPMIVMFHGLGEAGPNTDNEYQLYHGGEIHKNWVDNGNFDGYVLFMQSTGFWGLGHYGYLTQIIDYMIANNKLDVFRISVNGLSAGAQGTWEMTLNYPTLVASTQPMSGISIGYKDADVVNKLKFNPIWNFNGGADYSPAPSTCDQVKDAFVAAGGNYKNSLYADLGHGTWDRAYAEPDFLPFILRAHKANPWALTGRTEFCPGDPINVTLGLSPGFSAYEWRKNGVLIPGANTNQITVTVAGTYDCRVKRGSLWSVWSPVPAVVKTKAPTVSPAITVSGLMSKVIPALDGNTGVNLEIPDGYASYLWQKVGSGTTLSTTRTLTAPTPGDYRVKVTETFGCSSDFSAPFTVIDANGPNKPDGAINLLVTTISKTALRLDWSDNPNAVNDETAFEIYQSQQAGGPYTYVKSVAANVLTTTMDGLHSNAKYFFKVRAINNTAAATPSNEGSGSTSADTQAPSAPANLAIAATNKTSITLKWNRSLDDVEIARYFVYINGVKSYITTDTFFLVHSLEFGKNYTFAVKAADFAGNTSPFSNQVSGQPLLKGLKYKYYTFTGTWNNLPDFNTLTPVATGSMNNVAITPRTQNDNFAFLWEGFINIPVTGSYTFRTNSDDGSKLYLSTYSFGATALVNNDGLHGGQNKDGTITLTAGVYPIAISFYEQSSGESMTVSWSTPQNATFVPIPDAVFSDAPTPLGGQVPAAPLNVTATALSFNKIKLDWTDGSNNESAFEIYRSTGTSDYITVGTAAANSVSYTDSSLLPNTKYNYRVRAINQYGESGFSASGSAGINYSYYELSGISTLPDFNALTPKKTGLATKVGLGAQDRADNFQFKFGGYINISADGSYTFYTSSDDGSKLYIDGFDAAHMVVNNDGAHGTQEASGTITLTRGFHSIYVTFFEAGGGEVLTASIAGPGLSKQEIPASMLFLDQGVNATTLALPAAPAAPTALLASGVSSSVINVSWNYSAGNATGFELWRSNTTNGNYVLFTTVPAGLTSYADTGLFANTVQYYKIRSIGLGGSSAFSNEDSAKVKNNIPFISDVASRSARYGTTTAVALTATDNDGDALSFAIQNMPAFATFVDNGNKSATLNITPSSANQGVYNNIKVIVTDTHGGSDTTSFDLTVNNNYSPVVDSIPDYVVNEGSVANIALHVADQNAGDVFVWSSSNVPGTPSIVPGANGNANLTFQPGFGAAGVYNISVNVNDGNGGISARQFKLTVLDKDPTIKIYARFAFQGTVVPPFNNVTSVNTTNLKDANGTTTSVGLAFNPASWWSTYNGGPSTGNNSGIYPDVVLNEYYYFGIFGGPETSTVTVNGLTPGKLYSLSFFSSSIWNGTYDNGSTIFTVGNKTAVAHVQNNTQTLATLSDVAADVSGNIVVTMSKGADAMVGYLNSMLISTPYDDGTAPAAPANLLAENVSGQGVKLSWKDVAYNESGYKLYRGTVDGGTFTLMSGTINANDTTFMDGSVNGGVKYYYKLNAVNTYGVSPFTSVASVTTTDRIPSITPINSISLKNNQTQTISIIAVDDPTDHIRLSVANLPSFATFTDNGDGTGSINIQPQSGSVGVYSGVTITAKDDSDSSRSVAFDISVVDKDVSSVYVNFSDGTFVGNKPWNNFSLWPAAGAAMSNLKDDGGADSGISLSLLDSWESIFNYGMRPGNGTTVYPEDVARIALIESSTNAKRIKISGLSTAKKYNFVFYNSHDFGLDGTTLFIINTDTVKLNAAYNLNKTVQINGITPPANGEVTIRVVKATGAEIAFINTLVIQSYSPALDLLAPSDLRVIETKKNAIKLQWADRSYAETGFEIWRASSQSSVYSLLTTVAAKTTSYLDSNLTSNSSYYYIVRAKKNNTYSAYTPVVSSTTLAYHVYVNFTSIDIAPTPWNNTMGTPEAGHKWGGFLDDKNQPTSTGVEITKSFSEVQPLGMFTGNNSGTFPDNVIKKTYCVFPGVTGELKVTGLNLGMKYNLTLFGSSAGWGNYNSAYYINGKRYVQNASLNVGNGRLIVYGLQPDENGEITVTVVRESVYSLGGYLCGVIVSGYQSSDSAAPSAPVSMAAARASAQIVELVEDASTEIKAYPNPFTSTITLSVPALANDEILITVYNLTGQLVYNKRVANLVEGNNSLQIQSTSAMAARGMYIMKVAFLNRHEVKVLKLNKQ